MLARLLLVSLSCCVLQTSGISATPSSAPTAENIFIETSNTTSDMAVLPSDRSQPRPAADLTSLSEPSSGVAFQEISFDSTTDPPGAEVLPLDSRSEIAPEAPSDQPSSAGPPQHRGAATAASCDGNHYRLLGVCRRRRPAGRICWHHRQCLSGRCGLLGVGLCRRPAGDFRHSSQVLCDPIKRQCPDGTFCARFQGSWHCLLEERRRLAGEECDLNADCASRNCDPRTGRCVCPRHFAECRNHCYLPVASKRSYYSAVAMCAAAGAILAVPRSEAENRCLADLAKTYNSDGIWLGFEKNQLNETYIGADGEPITYQSFGLRKGRPVTDAEPDDAAKFCVMFSIAHPRYRLADWYDENCWRREHMFVCQLG